MQMGKRWQTYFRICISAGLALIFATATPRGVVTATKSHQDSLSEKPTTDYRMFLQRAFTYEYAPVPGVTEMPPKDTTDLALTPPTEALPMQASDLMSITAPEPGPPVTTWVLIIAVLVIISIIVHIVISRRSQD